MPCFPIGPARRKWGMADTDAIVERILRGEVPEGDREDHQ
jgi:hypothetical protein